MQTDIYHRAFYLGIDFLLKVVRIQFSPFPFLFKTMNFSSPNLSTLSKNKKKGRKTEDSSNTLARIFLSLISSFCVIGAIPEFAN